jgi:MFS family permease
LNALRALLTPALTLLLAFQVVSGIMVAPMFSLFPVYVEQELHLSSTFTALLRILFVALGGVVAVVGGFLLNWLGRKSAYVLAMSGVVATGAMFLTDSPWTMAGLGVYAGLMFGLGSVAGQAYLMNAATPATLGLATAAFFMTGTAGNAIGNFLAGRIAKQPDGYSIIGIATLIGQTLLVLAAARWMPRVEAVAKPESEVGTPSKRKPSLLSVPIGCLLTLRFGATVYWGMVTLLMPLVLARLTGGPSASADYTAVNLLLSAVCQIAMGRLVDRVGVRVPVPAAAAILAAAAVVQTALHQHVWALWTFGIIAAGAAWSLSVTMTSLVRALSDESSQSHLLGITHGVWSAGFVGGTLLTGFLASKPGNEALPFALGAGFCVVAAVAALFLMPFVPLRSIPDEDF